MINVSAQNMGWGGGKKKPLGCFFIYISEMEKATGTTFSDFS